MEKLTENEKYHALLCVKYVKMELNERLFKAEVKYESYTHYDAELDQIGRASVGKECLE